MKYKQTSEEMTLRKAPKKGYVLSEWNSTNDYRATAIAYMKRERINAIENIDGNLYSLEELEKSSIGN